MNRNTSAYKDLPSKNIWEVAETWISMSETNIVTHYFLSSVCLKWLISEVKVSILWDIICVRLPDSGLSDKLAIIISLRQQLSFIKQSLTFTWDDKS